jgi:hypothetical protein
MDPGRLLPSIPNSPRPSFPLRPVETAQRCVVAPDPPPWDDLTLPTRPSATQEGGNGPPSRVYLPQFWRNGAQAGSSLQRLLLHTHTYSPPLKLLFASMLTVRS